MLFHSLFYKELSLKKLLDHPSSRYTHSLFEVEWSFSPLLLCLDNFCSRLLGSSTFPKIKSQLQFPVLITYRVSQKTSPTQRDWRIKYPLWVKDDFWYTLHCQWTQHCSKRRVVIVLTSKEPFFPSKRFFFSLRIMKFQPKSFQTEKIHSLVQSKHFFPGFLLT